MKNSIYLFLIILLGFTYSKAIAQNNSFTISGQAYDTKNENPIQFAQVALFKENAKEPETFTNTDENGNFMLQAERGEYELKIFFIGYKDKILSDIQLSENIELGKVEMINENNQLDEVEVTGTKPMVRTTVEGITINPDQNLSNLGGTLLDILRNTPSVRVGDDGSISLRGSSGTNVLINGRNSSLTRNLDRIPASSIDEIKVINNPNARYDAEAEAGIIDIKLKKGDKLGTNGGIDGLYGTRGRSSLGGQINHRDIRYNVYAGYNYRNWKNVGDRRVSRTIFEDAENLSQNTNSESQREGHTFNYGADYYFGNNTLSYEGVLSTSYSQQVNTLFSQLTDTNSDDLILEYVRRNSENETDDGYDNAIIYERDFKEKERSFKFSASQSYTNQFKTQNIEIFRGTQTTDESELNGREQAFTDEKRYNYVFQADYIHPFEDKIKLETGLKSNIRNFTYDFDFSRFSFENQDFEDDPAVSNEFDYQDRIHAGYVVLSKSFAKLDIIAGVRGELTQLNTYLYNTDEENSQEYFNLFPSLQTLYKLTDNQSFKFTYSRRIDRPTAWRLNPFPDITDSLNVRRGNPELQPELINSIELGHIFEGKKSSLTTNFFYRQIQGRLDYITIVEDGISYSEPANLNTAESYGVEVIGLKDITPWWTLNGSVTGFNIRVDGSNISEEFTNNGYALNSKLTSDFKLPYDITIQLVGNYDSPEIEAQGSNLAQYYIDASIQKSFLDKKGSISLSARDIFDSLRYAGDRLTNSFSQTYYSKRETRIFLLSARYSF
ncbi:outer membrane beta-barrel family protein [Marivirga tractuosa]|uniref:TonB-dependent receptor domain-containing protein n=1 Tax=Marivirga tractuosa TaxID=1006 RepID=UPI0035D03CB5